MAEAGAPTFESLILRNECAAGSESDWGSRSTNTTVGSNGCCVRLRRGVIRNPTALPLLAVTAVRLSSAEDSSSEVFSDGGNVQYFSCPIRTESRGGCKVDDVLQGHPGCEQCEIKTCTNEDADAVLASGVTEDGIAIGAPEVVITAPRGLKLAAISTGEHKPNKALINKTRNTTVYVNTDEC